MTRETSPRQAFLRKIIIVTTFGLAAFFAVLTSGWARHPPHPVGGSEWTLLSNQTRHDLCLGYCAAIGRAKKSVLLIIYGLHNPQVVNALKRKAAAGVAVRVICDKSASRGVAKALGPDIETVYKVGPGLMHHKILVIDREEVWLGSANMTTESLRHHGNLVLCRYDKALAEQLCSYGELMDITGNPLTCSDGCQHTELWLLPDGGQAFNRLLSLISSAKRSCRVAMYTYTHPDLVDALINAKDRGIIVDVVLDRSASRGASRQAAKALRDAGVSVRCSDCPGLLHHKMLIIDDRCLVTGSANWTRAASKKNDDAFVVLNEITTEQKYQLAELWHVISCQTESMALR